MPGFSRHPLALQTAFSELKRLAGEAGKIPRGARKKLRAGATLVLRQLESAGHERAAELLSELCEL